VAKTSGDHLILHGCSELVTPDAHGNKLVRIPDGALAMRAGRVLQIGPSAELLARHADARTMDAGRRLVTPGLVDCHTHMLFAGRRAAEFQRRLAGESYAQIAASGGGIRATVRVTVAASYEALAARLRERLALWRAGGCTTVEVKSGYGLTPESERRLLEIMRDVARAAPVRMRRTALLLHALPEDWRDRRKEYVDAMIAFLSEVRADDLASAVDVYCDEVAFTVDECRAVLDAARSLGLALRLHAEQFTRTGGSVLAASLRALSADHLENATEDDWRTLAAAGTVGVLLPGAALTLGQRLPSAALLRASGARVAIATDFNPGTSPAQSLVECAALAARLSGLSAEEALLALTWNPARALGVERDGGHLRPGSWADAVIWECEALEELTYWLPGVRARTVLVGGSDCAS
jgi:imidazolonepropionase